MLSISPESLLLQKVWKALCAMTSSREGLERGDRDIGDPVDEKLDIEEIPEEALDILRDDSKIKDISVC